LVKKIKRKAVEHLLVRCWKEEHPSDIYGADSWNVEKILQASMAALRPLLLLPHLMLV